LNWQKRQEQEGEKTGEEISTLVIGEEILKICRSHKDGLLIALDGFLPEGIVEFFAHGENGPKVATAICFTGEGVWKKDKAGQVAEVTLDFGLSQKQKMILEADDLMLIPADAKEQIKISFNDFLMSSQYVFSLPLILYYLDNQRSYCQCCQENSRERWFCLENKKGKDDS
jgi:hypothetical protein